MIRNSPEDGPLGKKSAPRRSNSFVESLARGLEVIRAFGGDAEHMTLSEVAKRTGLTRANVRRVLLTLVELGYVEQDERYFQLRPKILDLGYAYLSSASLGRIAQPSLERLAREVNCPTSLSVLEGKDIVYIARAIAGTPVHLHRPLNIGTRLPAHITAMGRVLLGALSEPEFNRYLALAEWPRLTAQTVTEPGRIRDIVRHDRQAGWSFLDSELSDYTFSLAAPVRGVGGDIVAAVSLGSSGATTKDSAAQTLLPALLVAAREISDLALKSHIKALGWQAG